MVTDWSPTEEEEVQEEGGGWEEADGVSWGPGMAVVGMTEEDSDGGQEGGEEMEG